MGINTKVQDSFGVAHLPENPFHHTNLSWVFFLPTHLTNYPDFRPLAEVLQVQTHRFFVSINSAG